MNWLHTIVVAVLNGAVGLVCAGLIAALCVRWYRVSSFEGEAGFYLVGLALLGGILGVAIGVATSLLVGTRVGAAIGVGPGFLRTLGWALATTLLISGLATVISRALADLPPTLNGRDLELVFEVRTGQGFTPAYQRSEYEPFAVIRVLRGRRQPQGTIDIDEARREGDRWIVPGTVPLDTSKSRKYLRVYFSDDFDELFHLPLRRHPDERDMSWSEWIEGGWDPAAPEPPPEKKFAVRYRVQ